MCGTEEDYSSPAEEMHFSALPLSTSIATAPNTSGAHTPQATRALRDLKRLARFGANLADAHSCFIFIPIDIFHSITRSNYSGTSGNGSFSPRDAITIAGTFAGAHSGSAGTGSVRGSQPLVLAAYHSLSSSVISQALLPEESGIVSWVARHGRAIHISPFERDARTLGVYESDQQLKSFYGVPIWFEKAGSHQRGASRSNGTASKARGVIACDSRKSFAFSKIQGKLLEDLSCEVANTLDLHLDNAQESNSPQAWDRFLRSAEDLATNIGGQSLEIVRICVTNAISLEAALGSLQFSQLLNQLARLIQQALPAQYPSTRLINGDIILAIDSMMSSFVESKVKALAEHLAIGDSTLSRQNASAQLQLSFFRSTFRRQYSWRVGGNGLAGGDAASVEDLISETARSRAQEIPVQSGGNVIRLEKEVGYGNRRA